MLDKPKLQAVVRRPRQLIAIRAPKTNSPSSSFIKARCLLYPQEFTPKSGHVARPLRESALCQQPDIERTKYLTGSAFGTRARWRNGEGKMQAEPQDSAPAFFHWPPRKFCRSCLPTSLPSIFFLFFVAFVAAAVLLSVPDVVSVSAWTSGAVGTACDAGAVAGVGAASDCTAGGWFLFKSPPSP